MKRPHKADESETYKSQEIQQSLFFSQSYHIWIKIVTCKQSAPNRPKESEFI